MQVCDDQPGEIDALTLLGAIYLLSGDRGEGVKLFEQALTLSQSVGDIWRQAQVNYFLGWDHSDYQRSFAYWEKAVVLFSEAGDQVLRRILMRFCPLSGIKWRH